jgi:hypothetical protein
MDLSHQAFSPELWVTILACDPEDEQVAWFSH